MTFLVYKDSLLQPLLTTNKDRTSVLDIPFLRKDNHYELYGLSAATL